MASTGYGRISTINRIPYYKGSSSRSSRSYRGVKVKAVAADISTRLAKAQDAQMLNAYNAGTISSDTYLAYLSNRISTTSDPTYNAELTKQMQNIVTNGNEKTLTDGYAAGTTTAAQVADYYKNKLTGIDMGNPLYAETQAQIAKWGAQATKDAYSAQEAVLQSNYDAATGNKLPAAQALLDYNLQMLPQMQKGTAEYNSTITKIGQLQGEVKTLTNQQNLLQAEAKISDIYTSNSSQDLSAKSQMYAQLRDAAAQMGDITNYYKYDTLANTYADRATAAQTKEQSQQVSKAIQQVHLDYIAGKIDGATAQSQLEQISIAADGIGDTSGVLLAHDLYNTIDSNLAHGVVYGSQGGFGKTKGGSGGSDNQLFDLSTGQPVGGISTSSASNSSSGSAYAGGVPASKLTSPTTFTNGNTSLVNDVLRGAGVINAPQSVIDMINQHSQQGATMAQLVDEVRTLKIGTGDGYQAIADQQKANQTIINSNLSLGYDPTNGLPYTTQTFQTDMLATNVVAAHNYTAWQQFATANPNYKININGTNTKMSTLAPKIDTILNGTTTVDPATGLTKSDKAGLLDSIQTLSSPNTNLVVVENPSAPGTYMVQTKADFKLAQGQLNALSYVQDENGVYHYVNVPKPIQTQW
ncbi:MAG: hypothetical protein KGI08_03235, partial [Thaumarchaeota archaeon]|nr:hypothetical protein [Nitrososphaerota archaeon]